MARLIVENLDMQNASAFAILMILSLFLIVISFGFILPVNAPQNMITYGTDTFEARDFIRIGLAIMLVAMRLLVVFALTYWPWRGYMPKPV